MYELALAEWGLTPEYINRNWTDEILTLMFKKRKERHDRLFAPAQTGADGPAVLSNEAFAKKHPRVGPEVVRVRRNHGG